MSQPNPLKAIQARRIYDGNDWHDNAAVLVQDGLCAGITKDIPQGVDITVPKAEILVPGFVDLQVNGGGGIQFNDDPSVESIQTIITAHARCGTTSLLPTLITDTLERTQAALVAARQAKHLPGFLGLHLEGPHLDPSRKGAHVERLIRPMNETDLATLISAKADIPVLVVTLAPESVTPEQIAALDQAGIVVSLGHSNCSYDDARRAFAAGARMVTHLFNAMSPLSHRAPGLVGAALDSGAVSCGIIADGIHVAPPVLRTSIRAKATPGEIFVVSDAMAPLGTDMDGFALNGRKILRQNGRLVLQDGTLAGADIDMASSVQVLVNTVGIELDQALQMVSATPARAIGLANTKGKLKTGMSADIVALDRNHKVINTWVQGIANKT